LIEQTDLQLDLLATLEIHQLHALVQDYA